jgi:hypothetical protein
MPRLFLLIFDCSSPQSWLTRMDPNRSACLLLAAVFLAFPAFLLLRLFARGGPMRSVIRGLQR